MDTREDYPEMTLYTCARCKDCSEIFECTESLVLEARVGMHETFGCGLDRGFVYWQEWKR